MPDQPSANLAQELRARFEESKGDALDVRGPYMAVQEHVTLEVAPGSVPSGFNEQAPLVNTL